MSSGLFPQIAALCSCFGCLVLANPEPAVSEREVKPVSQASPSQQPVSPESIHVFEPWMHPLEALIKIAINEPDCLAIYTNEGPEPQRFTYRQVWDHAYSIAMGLKALPAWSDDIKVIGLYIDTEAHWVYYTYAVWILGKQVINFALNWPANTRREICQRLGIKILLHGAAKPGYTDYIEAVDGRTFPLLESIPEPSLSLCAPLEEYVAFLSTSGTTGIPKTFPVSHKFPAAGRGSWPGYYVSTAVVNKPSFVAGMARMVGGANVKSSLWFPKSTTNIVQQSAEIVRLLDDGLEELGVTPSVLKLIFTFARQKDKNKVWPAVKNISLTGESVSTALVTETLKICPNTIISCGYGSSETGLFQAIAYCIIRPGPTPERLVYTLKKPNIRCVVLNEAGDIVTGDYPQKGILCYAISKDDPLAKLTVFANTDPRDKLASFGHLPDGSPRICTLDEAELIRENTFVVLGRFGRKIKINGVFVDLQFVEDLLTEKMAAMITGCAVVQTSDQKITMLYVLSRRSSAPKLTTRQILDMAGTILAFENIVSVPINNCIELSEMPYNDSGKRDLKRLKRLADQAGYYGLAITYDPLPTNQSSPEVSIALRVARMGSDILGVDMFDGRNYYIAGIGFDSLTAVRLSLAIREEYDVEVPPHVLLAHGMTPKSVAKFILDIQEKRNFALPSVNLAFEVEKLDHERIAASGLPPFDPAATPKAIVLTGVTGFLGAFLLFELAKVFPSSDIICLVRAKTDAEALQRIRDVTSNLVWSLRTSPRPDFDIWERVKPVCGDLALENWGLSPQRWNQLAIEADIIVHNGAHVHWLYPYETLVATNVIGTATGLKLATTHHLKAFHYISTIGAIPNMHESSETVLAEKIYTDWTVSGGYNQTKWVSEQLVNRARSRGVPATITRPSIIAGDSRHGVSNSDDYIWRYVKGCIQLGITPAHASSVCMNLIPVDIVAQTIAKIVSTPESLNLFVFHIYDRENRSFGEHDIFEVVASLGWKLTFESREQFKSQLRDASYSQDQVNALLPLMYVVMTMTYNLDNANTVAIAPCSLPHPANTVAKCLEYLIRVRYLPPPSKPPSLRLVDMSDFGNAVVFGRTGRK
ncbi:male sterility protein-domain-containing protein [Polychytrium aggregatum]|uniref:male sterility protein-domain-containing protein n=1 Tax=Polychytrium aggregatum TaxID=110093 RepID=UPI0022FE41E7|nr:male sterility protein-domain-containing protein [Polychytrium aggregatum]KAI9203603.1 male sterility protein-domain-containing protein [Polychytrium aggregatum]